MNDDNLWSAFFLYSKGDSSLSMLGGKEKSIFATLPLYSGMNREQLQALIEYMVC